MRPEAATKRSRELGSYDTVIARPCQGETSRLQRVRSNAGARDRGDLTGQVEPGDRVPQLTHVVEVHRATHDAVEHRLGGEQQGWQVLGTHLEFEHGGGGRAFPRDETLDDLVSFVKGSRDSGGTMGSDPVIQQKTMDAFIESHVQGLLAKRTHWMYQNKLEIRFEGNMANVHSRESGLRNSMRVREVMGMYSFLDTEEPGAPFGGAQDVRQRGAAGQRHPGGSTNIAKVVLARRIGISRTQERPAPTPSTTSS